MGCGGSSLQDLSNQAKTAVSQAKDTAQANGLEKVEVLNTGKEALVAVKDKGVNMENLKDIADKNGIKSSELLNTGKDLLLATSKPEVDNIKMKDIQETKPEILVNAVQQSEKIEAGDLTSLKTLDQNKNIVKKESVTEIMKGSSYSFT